MRSLLTSLKLCGPAGADGARTLLEQSLQEEGQMASWVDQNIETVRLRWPFSTRNNVQRPERTQGPVLCAPQRTFILLETDAAILLETDAAR
jgi:hypothetical protein